MDIFGFQMHEIEKSGTLICFLICRAINGGSPYNVPAGHGSANLEHLVAFYKEKFIKEETEKIEKLKAKGQW